MESIIEIIKQRKSVRSFDGTPLRSDHVADVQQSIKQLTSPFDAKVRINLLNVDVGQTAVRLGTYGIISGTNSFLTLVIDNSPLADIAGGYVFEEVILHCTALGLGTCWLGGTIRRSDFVKQLQLTESEKLIAVAPIGYKKEKRRAIESVMRYVVSSDHRKPFGNLFFQNNFNTPLNETDAGAYLIPLQMLRLAPSASNQQPWRVIKQGDTLHFYHHTAPFSINDLGIALCHFELSCKELHLEGKYQVIKDIPSTNKDKYIISWNK
jgi:nitroreductase